MSNGPVAPGPDRFLVVAFWLLYVAAGAQTGIATDTARDLLAAWDIVQGVHYPLRGPELYATWHLGPIWHYLLALPLWLSHSAAWTALLVAMLAGLKLPLAYRLGFHFGGPALARLALIAIALPGWWMFEWLVASHTNLAASCVLGYALCLLHWSRRDRMMWLAGAGLLFSLALHAHPTALFWGWLVLPAFWQRQRQGGIRWTQTVPALLLFLLPFAPMLVDEARHGWPMWSGTRAFVASRSELAIASRVLPFLRDLLVLDGVRMPAQFMLGPPWLALALHLLQCLLVLLAVVGLWARRVAHAPAAWLAATALVLAASFVVLLRPEVPYWMTYALMPGVAAFLALGWHRLYLALVARAQDGAHPARALPWRRALIAVWVIAGLAFVTLAGQRIHASSQGWVAVPYRVVGRYADPAKRVDDRVPNAIYPVFGQERLTRWLCAQQQPPNLHGDGAALQRLNQGSLRLLHCAQGPRAGIGGDTGAALALYPAFLVQQAGLDSAPSFGAMREVAVKRVLHAAQPESDEVIRAYPPWLLTQQPVHQFEVEVPAGHQIVAISNLRPVFNGLDEPRLLVDGAVRVPVARTAVTWLFRLPAGRPGRLIVKTGDPGLIEVLALRETPRG
jgi:hypothetical protein